MNNLFYIFHSNNCLNNFICTPYWRNRTLFFCVSRLQVLIELLVKIKEQSSRKVFFRMKLNTNSRSICAASSFNSNYCCFNLNAYKKLEMIQQQTKQSTRNDIRCTITEISIFPEMRSKFFDFNTLYRASVMTAVTALTAYGSSWTCVLLFDAPSQFEFIAWALQHPQPLIYKKKGFKFFFHNENFWVKVY